MAKLRESVGFGHAPVKTSLTMYSVTVIAIVASHTTEDANQTIMIALNLWKSTKLGTQ